MKKISSLLTILVIILFTSCGTNEITNITLSQSSANLTIGQVDSIVATITLTGDLSKIPVNWTNSNAASVKIEESTGSSEVSKSSSESTSTITVYLTGLTSGKSTISVQAGDKTYSCEVTVDDKINPQLTQAELWYYGDVYGTTVSNNFTLYLGSDGINMDDLSGNGEVMFIEINTGLTVTDSIPSGTYEVTELNIDKFLPFTLVPGYVDNGDSWGSWYFGNTYNDVVTGYAIVSVQNKVYSIEYNMIDYYGNTISGTYNGTISYFDATAQYSPAATKALKVKRASAMSVHRK